MDADKLIDQIDSLILEARNLLTKIDDLKSDVEDEFEGDDEEVVVESLEDAAGSMDEVISALGRAKP